MKLSRYYLIFLLLFISSVLIGCQPQGANKIQESVLAQTDEKIILPITDDPIKPDYKTKVSEYTVDLDSDNVEETIELYTSAERYKGKMMWDDGQKWLLVVKDDKKFYTLFSEYVQLGQVYFSVYFLGENRIPMINVFVSSGKLTNYVFDKDKQGYRENSLYVSKDIKGMSFTSLPSY